MKKIITLIIAATMLMAVVSCKTQPEPQPESELEQRRDLPQFFLTPPQSDDMIYGMGMAKMSSDSLSKDTATARARTDIAFQVQVRVEAMLSDYAQESGTQDDTQYLTFVESISRQVSEINLQGAKVVENYPASDGTWYALVAFPVDALMTETGNVFARNEEAAFAEFKATQALERLDASLTNDPLTSSANAAAE